MNCRQQLHQNPRRGCTNCTKLLFIIHWIVIKEMVTRFLDYESTACITQWHDCIYPQLKVHPVVKPNCLYPVCVIYCSSSLDLSILLQYIAGPSGHPCWVKHVLSGDHHVRPVHPVMQAVYVITGPQRWHWPMDLLTCSIKTHFQLSRRTSCIKRAGRSIGGHQKTRQTRFYNSTLARYDCLFSAAAHCKSKRSNQASD